MHFFVQGRETRKAVSVRAVEGGTVCVKVSALSPAFQVNALKMTGDELPTCARVYCTLVSARSAGRHTSRV